jgi:hypothetical protein
MRLYNRVYSEGIVFSLFVVLFAAKKNSVHCKLNFWSLEIQNNRRKIFIFLKKIKCFCYDMSSRKRANRNLLQFQMWRSLKALQLKNTIFYSKWITQISAQKYQILWITLKRKLVCLIKNKIWMDECEYNLV